MLWAIRQLFVPVNYLRIRHGDTLFRSKKVYDYVLPVLLAAATCGIFWWLNLSPRLFEHKELVKSLTDLLALMIVFYMAALAAVATFDRAGIDEPLKGGDALLWSLHREKGEHFDRKLSYRQFISYLFGYLSFLSLCLYLVLILFTVGWPALERHFIGHGFLKFLQRDVDPFIFAIIFFAVWQLMITSLLGIYFLTDRIQSLYDDFSLNIGQRDILAPHGDQRREKEMRRHRSPR